LPASAPSTPSDQAKTPPAFTSIEHPLERRALASTLAMTPQSRSLRSFRSFLRGYEIPPVFCKSGENTPDTLDTPARNPEG
jgi:hypothetical protein